MLRQRVAGVACIACIITAASTGCARHAPVSEMPPRETTAAMAVSVPVSLRDTAAWVDSILTALTPRQRAAQMMMFWMLGDYTAVDDTTFAENVSWVEREGVGGISISLGTPV